ncbi:unnamed protein product, partial [Musa textilis]
CIPFHVVILIPRLPLLVVLVRCRSHHRSVSRDFTFSALGDSVHKEKEGTEVYGAIFL